MAFGRLLRRRFGRGVFVEAQKLARFFGGDRFRDGGGDYFGWVRPPETVFAAPDFSSVFLKLDIFGALKLSLLPTIMAIMFTDLFDSISTLVGVSHAAGLVDENGEPKNLKEGLVVDSFATLGAGLFGSSPGTAYIESMAGIEMGGRTGWTAVFCALCFIPCLFLAPLAGVVPPYATAVVLLLVGVYMFRCVSRRSSLASSRTRCRRL